MLDANYLALIQILVYVGAISVLFIFGVMLSKRNDVTKSNLFNKYKWIGTIVSIFLLGIMSCFLYRADWSTSIAKAAVIDRVMPTVDKIIELLLTDYVVPFEAAGIMLLVAMVGAIIIAKGEEKSSC